VTKCVEVKRAPVRCWWRPKIEVKVLHLSLCIAALNPLSSGEILQPLCPVGRTMDGLGRFGPISGERGAAARARQMPPSRERCHSLSLSLSLSLCASCHLAPFFNCTHQMRGSCFRRGERGGPPSVASAFAISILPIGPLVFARTPTGLSR
jgi:hypothetical protein